MRRIARREVLIGGATLLGLAATDTNPVLRAASTVAEVGKVDRLAPDVYFHEGNLQQHGHCNNGWVIFEDYVLVIDANYPSGAQEILPKIRALTDKPIRFAFDTHHHSDHTYGNQIWVDNGAVPIAHTGVIEEMKRYETGYYGGKAGAWEEEAKQREDLRNTHLKPPSVLFPKELIFDDGKHRVELLHLGVAHTHGDAVAWLPKERILFTGDVCVNGPYNYVADGDIAQWLKTLDVAQKLGAHVVCPGHGPRGVDAVLNDQQQFFHALRRSVGRLVRAKKKARDIHNSLEKIKAEIASSSKIARYIGEFFPQQVEKVYTEMTGEKFSISVDLRHDARKWHAKSHGF